MLKNLSRFITRYNFANEVQKTTSKASSSAGLTYYKDGQLTTRQNIVLKKTEDIESYVIRTIQNYYRSTYKQGNKLIIQVSLEIVNSQIMDLTLLTALKLLCRLNKI